MRRLLCCLIAILVLFTAAPKGWAQVHEHESDNGTRMVRSLESLRDLDYDSWQAVAYREGKPGEPVVLRHRWLSRQTPPGPSRQPSGGGRPQKLGSGRHHPGQSGPGQRRS